MGLITSLLSYNISIATFFGHDRVKAKTPDHFLAESSFLFLGLEFFFLRKLIISPMIICNADDVNVIHELVNGEEKGTLFLAHPNRDFDLMDYINTKYEI